MHLFLILEALTIIYHLLVDSAYLELFQLVLNINCQGWVHGLILVDKVLESDRKYDT